MGWRLIEISLKCRRRKEWQKNNLQITAATF